MITIVQSVFSTDSTARTWLGIANGLIGGLPLSKYYAGRDNDILVCVTETNTREQIDALAAALAG